MYIKTPNYILKKLKLEAIASELWYAILGCVVSTMIIKYVKRIKRMKKNS